MRRAALLLAAAAGGAAAMRAVKAGGKLDGSGPLTGMDAWVQDVAAPTPGKGQVLIRVNASSPNPVDVDLVTNAVEAAAAKLFHKTLGFDVAGVVAAVGPGGDGRLAVGDEVWADLDKLGLTEGIAELGAWAELAVADADQVSKKPASLSMSEAGVMPLVALTGYRAFLLGGAPWDRRDNVSVLITSGQGGTGHVGVQLAKALGAGYVVSVADTEHVDYVRSLGADEVVDFKKANVWDVVANNSFNMIYDNIGLPGNSDHAMAKLQSNGTLVIIQGKLAQHPRKDVKQINFLCDNSKREDLDAIAALVDKGLVTPRVQQSFPLSQIGEAMQALHAGGTIGKIGITVA